MDDRSKYIKLFLSEATELLDSLDMGLIKFEKDVKNKSIAQELMRYAHTLKGMSAEMGFGDISNLAHSFEGMVENIKNSVVPESSAGMLFGVVDELRSLIQSSASKNGDKSVSSLTDTVGEIVQADKEQETKIVEDPELFHKITEVKVATEKLDTTMELVAELMVNKMRIDDVSAQLSADVGTPFAEALEEHARLIEDLQYRVLQLRLTPLVQVFNRFPRMIRDLSHRQGKKVKFVMEHGEIEIDRSILDRVGEPLLHLLRNAVDHGIEEEGTITLSARREKDYVLIRLEDDGKGIDWQKVASKYKIKMSEAGTVDETLKNQLFSGISTAKEVTDISGRGVGLSVVKMKIEAMGGRVDVESPLSGKDSGGTAFTLRVPVSIAIIKALIVRVNERKFAVPVTNVDRLIQLSAVVHKKQADQEVVVIGEEEVPIIRLDELFGLATHPNPQDSPEKNLSNKLAFIISLKGERVGFVIDHVLSQQDIIVKSFNTDMLRSTGYFSSVTILGDGRPVPIIDTDSLMNGG